MKELKMAEKLRWIKKDNKTICEVYRDGEWVENTNVNDNLSRFFHDSHDEPAKTNIRFKGITDNAYRG